VEIILIVWIPAYAGMTEGVEIILIVWIPAYAGMTEGVVWKL
jgi:hypothetical protein